MTKSTTQGDQEVQMDRRRAERRQDGEAKAEATEFNPPRRKKQRRRQIDPTTCERDYNNHEIEFMQALDAYKRSSGRMFPTCSEILEVIRDLGYVRLNEEERAAFASIDELEADLEGESLDGDDEDELAAELDEAAF